MKTNVTMSDISLFFKCCNTIAERSSKRSAELLSERRPNRATCWDAIKILHERKCTLHAATITVGVKWLGKLSADEQYVRFVKQIKKYYPYNGNQKYIFCFELTKTGVLHAHGVMYDTYWNNFIEAFSDFGSRNSHKDSFQLVVSEKYFAYMQKEQEYPTIHNFTKKFIDNVISSRNLKEDGGAPSDTDLHLSEDCEQRTGVPPVQELDFITFEALDNYI